MIIYILLILFPFSSICAFETSQIQLVESLPVETDLLLSSGKEDTQKIWIGMIQKAKKKIDIAQYYVVNAQGSLLEPVIQELEKAADNGVKIRVLVDHTQRNYDEATNARLQKKTGIEIRTIDYVSITGGIHHAKYWIIDNAEVFIGSQNFDWRSLEHIQELGLLIDDRKVASDLEAIFNYDWELAGRQLSDKSAEGAFPLKNAPAVTEKPAIQVVASPPGALPNNISYSEDVLMRLIRGAEKQIRIEIEKYTPVEIYTKDRQHVYWPDIDDALREAALIRHVKIDLMVSDWSIRYPADLAALRSLAMLPGITIKVVTIPPSKKGDIPFARLIHGKLMTIDGEVLWIGSSNWTKIYFSGARNVEIIVRDAKLVEEVDASFNRLWNSSYAKDILSLPVPAIPAQKAGING